MPVPLRRVRALHRKAWPHSLAPLVQNLVNDEIDTAADDEKPRLIGDERRRMSKTDANIGSAELSPIAHDVGASIAAREKSFSTSSSRSTT